MDNKPEVACLYNFVALQKEAQSQKINISRDTNRFMLEQTVRKLGPDCVQKLVTKLVATGEIKWDQNENFEVESIEDYVKEEGGKEYYLIKWHGWSNRHNTWEPRDNLECEELVEDYHRLYTSQNQPTKKRRYDLDDDSEDRSKRKERKIQDLMDRIFKKENDDITPMKLLAASEGSDRIYGLNRNNYRSVKFRHARNISNKRTNAYKCLRLEVKTALKNWEIEINRINGDTAPIIVENDVDLEGPPDNFTYISDYKVGQGITIPDDPLVGCECDDCLDNKKGCCAANAGAAFAYYKHKRVRLPPGYPIYECNRRCDCGINCPNRVVQFGRKFRVSIFRTDNMRGWGVRAMQKIKKGSFVMEYIGEVISNEEAERRGQVYDAEGRTYLFDLDYNDSDAPFCVDAGFYGNISHFVNHSCDPNLAVYGVWINHLDPRLPRIALFAKKDIARGEELTFDYMMTGAMGPAPGDISMTFADDTDEPPSEAGSTVSDLVTGTESLSDSHSDIAKPCVADFLQPLNEKESSDSSVKLTTEAVAQLYTGIERSPDKISQQHMGQNNNLPRSPGTGFVRRNMPLSSALKYRLRCQCGAKNCRQYLF